mgnify:CR=1 FL=1
MPKFLCKNIKLKVNNNNDFSRIYKNHQIIELPIAHSQGNYYLPDNELQSLKDNNQIIFRYSNVDGETEEKNNPNGSIYNIAGISNLKKNIIGMMPHPERTIGVTGKNDGSLFFKNFKNLL